jgi:hypothetical protein
VKHQAFVGQYFRMTTAALFCTPTVNLAEDWEAEQVALSVKGCLCKAIRLGPREVNPEALIIELQEGPYKGWCGLFGEIHHYMKPIHPLERLAMEAE